MAQIFLTTASASPWTVPSDWTNAGATVELVGAGGAGGDGSNQHGDTGGSGGDGGAYCKKGSLSFAAGQTYAFTVGAGGSAVDTSFDPSGLNLVAGAGQNGATGGGAGPGSAASGGDVNYGGGSGTAAGAGGGPGGGGGAAGPNGAGAHSGTLYGGAADGGVVPGGSGTTDGASQTGASGTEWDASHGCGAGGSGDTVTASNGGAGGQYGGGGSGASGSNGLVGGTGGDGLIVITYTPAAATAVSRDVGASAGFVLSRVGSGLAAAGFSAEAPRDSGAPIGSALLRQCVLVAGINTGIATIGDLSVPIAAHLAVEAVGWTPIAALRAVPSELIVPVGWTGATAATLSADRVGGVEWLARRNGRRTTPVGIGLVMRRATPMPTRWSARIELNRQTVIGSGVAAAAPATAAVETSRVAAVGSRAPTAWGSLAITVMIDAAVFVEWDRAVAAGFAPNPALEIVAWAPPGRDLAGSPARTSLIGNAGTALDPAADGPRRG